MPVNSSSCLLSCDLYPIYDSHSGGYTSLNQEHVKFQPLNTFALSSPCFIKSTVNTYVTGKGKRVSSGNSFYGLELQECKSLLRLPLLTSFYLLSVSMELERRYYMFTWHLSHYCIQTQQSHCLQNEPGRHTELSVGQ